MKKLLNPHLHKEGYNCFGCSPGNPIGLHLEFWEDGEDVVTTWSPASAIPSIATFSASVTLQVNTTWSARAQPNSAASFSRAP